MGRKAGTDTEADTAFDEASYLVALEGVSIWCLREAVRSILQGGLGHGWYPSPPEFRIHCDKIMKPITEALTREKREMEQRAAEIAERAVAPVDEAARARIRAKLQSFRLARKIAKQNEQNGGAIVIDHERAERLRKIMDLPDRREPDEEVLAFRRVITKALDDSEPEE